MRSSGVEKMAKKLKQCNNCKKYFKESDLYEIEKKHDFIQRTFFEDKPTYKILLCEECVNDQ